MKTYVGILRVTKTDGWVQIQPVTVTTTSFQDAVRLSLDTESLNWDEKRSKRELISLTLAGES